MATQAEYDAMVAARDHCKAQTDDASARLIETQELLAVVTRDQQGWAEKLATARSAVTSLHFKRAVAKVIEDSYEEAVRLGGLMIRPADVADQIVAVTQRDLFGVPEPALDGKEDDDG